MGIFSPFFLVFFFYHEKGNNIIKTIDGIFNGPCGTLLALQLTHSTLNTLLLLIIITVDIKRLTVGRSIVFTCHSLSRWPVYFRVRPK